MLRSGKDVDFEGTPVYLRRVKEGPLYGFGNDPKIRHF